MKRITVLDFTRQVNILSDKIPVTVKAGERTIGCFHTLYELPAKAMPELLEATISYVTLKTDKITIQVKLKAVTT